MDYLSFGIELVCVITMLGLLAPIASFLYWIVIDCSPLGKLESSSKLAFFNVVYYLILTSAIVHVCDRHRLESNTLEIFLVGFVVLLVLSFHDSRENVRQIKQERERQLFELFPVRTNFAAARFRWIIPIQTIALVAYPLICFFSEEMAHATASGSLVNFTNWVREIPLIGFAFHVWALFVGIGMLISFGTLVLIVSFWISLRDVASQGPSTDTKAA